LTIHTADCLPLLAFSKNVIGACHAGWRGLSQNVIENWVARLIAEGASRDSLKVAVGPAIGPCHFEVKKDVSQILTKNIPQSLLSGIKRSHLDPEKDFIDLKGLARYRLLKLGLRDENLSFSEDCTYCNEALYHSFRRDGAQKGQRLESVIVKPRH
jgi:YfiH family protein